jgi:hypothetical protein
LKSAYIRASFVCRMTNVYRFTKSHALAFIWLYAFLPLASTGRSAGVPAQAAQSRSLRDATRLSSIEVILPPRLVAGAPATLATLGSDHVLVGHVLVELGNGARVETDATGRANFTAPSGDVLIARAGGGSAAALIDSPSAAAGQALTVPRFAALHNRLDLCGGGFHGNAEANHVAINHEPALVLAASPECLVVIPGAKAAPGLAPISIVSTTPEREASVTLVVLDFEPPQPPLIPGAKGRLTVRARGSGQRLWIMVQNESPGVLQFERGEVQELTTSGGAQNVARVRVQAIRSGDFSFHARIVPPPDPEAARRFIHAAEPLAASGAARRLQKMEGDLARRPKDAEKVRSELDRLLPVTSPGDFRTLLQAARSAL